MYQPKPPRRVPALAGRSVLETLVIAAGTTVLFVAATLVAVAAVPIAGDDPTAAALVAVLVWLGMIAGGVVGVRRLGSALALVRRIRDRRRGTARAGVLARIR